MSSDDLLRGFFAALFSLVVAAGIWFRLGEEEPGEKQELRKRWAPLISPTLLPLYVVLLPVIALVIDGGEVRLAKDLLESFLGVFLHIGLYDMLLLALLPLLRRLIRARIVAVLWLIPNFLYITMYSYMRPSAPKLVLYIGSAALHYGLIVWAAGFAAVLLFGIGQHLLFRRSILRDAEPVTEPEILTGWEAMQVREAGLKKAKLRLVRSGQTQTPLSVGLFPQTMRVVLPKKDYTPEETELILRHELAHILRCDSQTKFFLRFCTAMCWFNPFLWIAMKKCAEDLELSCDEMVLEDADEAQRARYAELILNTAGDARGFTTCLSADAKALRYRLGSIVKPKKRLLGAMLAGVIFFGLVISSGWAALAYDTKPAAQTFSYQELSLLPEELTYVTVYENGSARNYRCADPRALLSYVEKLPVWKLTGRYAAPKYEGRNLFVLFHTQDGLVSLSLTDQSVDIGMPLKKERRYSELYYLQQPPDWEYVMGLLQVQEEKVYTLPCEMGLNFGAEITPEREFIDCAPLILSHSADGAPQILPEPPADGVGRLEGIEARDVQLIFYARTPDSCEITVEGLNGEAPYTQELREDFMLPLAAYDACYTVDCRFTDGEDEYDIRYLFEIVLPEE